MKPVFKIVIPARYASSRLPGKPLLDLNGQPMIQHVYQCALKAGAEQVVVATDDKRIVDAVKAFDGEVCMTSTQHQSGTDRLAEVAQQYHWTDETIVVNLQGDEPLTPASLLQQVAENLQQYPQAGMATLSTPLCELDEVMDPNIVKVVRNHQGMAMYFSRASIPWHRDEGHNLCAQHISVYQRHLGIYAYRVSFLKHYTDMPPCELENIEKLEQLRALYHGTFIHVEQARELPGPGIDTPDDVEKVSQLLSSISSRHL